MQTKLNISSNLGNPYQSKNQALVNISGFTMGRIGLATRLVGHMVVWVSCGKTPLTNVLLLYTVMMTGCAALEYPVQIRICILSMCIYLTNVTDNHDMYMDYLSKIAVFSGGY